MLRLATVQGAMCSCDARNWQHGGAVLVGFYLVFSTTSSCRRVAQISDGLRVASTDKAYPDQLTTAAAVLCKMISKPSGAGTKPSLVFLGGVLGWSIRYMLYVRTKLVGCPCGKIS